MANEIKNKKLNFALKTILLMMIRLKITLCDPYLETKYCIIARLKINRFFLKSNEDLIFNTEAIRLI